ncbi:hypothetical protein TRIATDRAFT_84020 [Trichoderma atroviride IMI 206040]|uniref:Uncharacterized protein n=1 Tax=Hypocrea atroviridis (strain ATCC 20476 / IMI 206040) TaxID=452589 RepID=G9P6C0_HYPAI|nr:uncharacterized protein TRIATDRAFT_84020 [Trichoderma atroviride IMI 206040]EHK42235.1 hypothetical protein TRIATDRAFT_84020 [Trichoderma atroviride IMI 206040]
MVQQSDGLQRQGAAYVTVLGRDATIGQGISGPVLDMGELADMGRRLMKTGACDWAPNGKNDGGIRRPRGFPAVPHRPPLRWDGGRRRALHARITKHEDRHTIYCTQHEQITAQPAGSRALGEVASGHHWRESLVPASGPAKVCGMYLRGQFGLRSHRSCQAGTRPDREACARHQLGGRHSVPQGGVQKVLPTTKSVPLGSVKMERIFFPPKRARRARSNSVDATRDTLLALINPHEYCTGRNEKPESDAEPQQLWSLGGQADRVCATQLAIIRLDETLTYWILSVSGHSYENLAWSQRSPPSTRHYSSKTRSLDTSKLALSRSGLHLAESQRTHSGRSEAPVDLRWNLQWAASVASVGRGGPSRAGGPLLRRPLSGLGTASVLSQ